GRDAPCEQRGRDGVRLLKMADFADSFLSEDAGPLYKQVLFGRKVRNVPRDPTSMPTSGIDAGPALDADATGAYDAGQFSPQDVGLGRQQAMSQNLRGIPPPAPAPVPAPAGPAPSFAGLTAAGIPLDRNAPPTGPMPPFAAGPAPAPNPVADYRAKALKAMQDAASAGEPTEEEKGESNRKLLLAMALGMKGGEAMQPFAAQYFKQALADPEAMAQRRQQRLEAQAKIYETMAAHAESDAQRAAALQAAAE